LVGKYGVVKTLRAPPISSSCQAWIERVEIGRKIIGIQKALEKNGFSKAFYLATSPG
jgi:hypothetical protein